VGDLEWLACCRLLLLCGLFVSRDDMALVLHDVSWALPLTYAFDALSRATTPGPLGAGLTADFAVVDGSTLAALAPFAATLLRRTA